MGGYVGGSGVILLGAQEKGQEKNKHMQTIMVRMSVIAQALWSQKPSGEITPKITLNWPKWR